MANKTMDGHNWAMAMTGSLMPQVRIHDLALATDHRTPAVGPVIVAL